jgi:transient receptor potential cation channel subfamily V protein 6
MIFFLGYYLVTTAHEDAVLHNTQLLGFTNMISWIRGLTYLRSIESTRIFIFLVVEMIRQLGAFIAVMFGGIVCFSTTAFIMQPKNAENKEIESIWNIFLLTLGEFAVDDLDGFGKAIFVIESFLMTIILLNLIIALMSDTYENIMTNIV